MCTNPGRPGWDPLQNPGGCPGIGCSLLELIDALCQGLSHESWVGSYLVLNLITGLNMCEINADFHCCLCNILALLR